ncbi:MAG: hypothetical protein QOE25_1435, partial [Actinomycetota bacterium]|nr:hypothetical protein [Actinomycetota bacterium]
SAFIEDGTGAYVGPARRLYAEHPDVTDGFGGFPRVVEDGANVGSLTPPDRGGDNPFWDANPRTAIGVIRGCEDGDIATSCVVYLVTVDGRQGAYSRGVEFPALGSLMLHLGSWDAMNTDGGGSTEMWMRRGKPRVCESDAPGGCILDRPSTGEERTVVQTIGLVP